MRTNASQVAETIRLFTRNVSSPAAQSALLAKTAVTARDKLIVSGRAASNTYQTFVDGTEGADERTVQPTGTILYIFNQMPRAAAWALDYLHTRSVVRTGRFQASWSILVNGQPYNQHNLGSILGSDEVIVVNPQPYARRLETANRVGRGRTRGLVEGARTAFAKQFPTLDVDVRYILLPPGVLPPAPWILKNVKKSRRRDRQAGQPITYPALIFKRKI